MRVLLFLLALTMGSFTISAQEKSKLPQPDPSKKLQEVEAACGQCKFAMPGNSCDLAVRIDGKAYFVDGTSIDDHGDAHDDDGFCNAIRKAKVQGEITGDRFRVTYFKLIADTTGKKKN